MKTYKKAVCLAVGLSASFLGLPGCGLSSDQPELGQVTGTVTLDGKPLSGVGVVFHPDGGRPASGTTDANGNYELRYIRETMGTKIGLNRVEIAPSEEGDEEEVLEVVGKDGEPLSLPPDLSAKPEVPARYNTKSELEADVQPGENTFDFALES